MTKLFIYIKYISLTYFVKNRIIKYILIFLNY